MEKISDRLALIINQEGISARSLEQQIGCSNGVLAKCMSRGTDISSLWLTKIIDTLPKYSGDWLLTGKGSMFNSFDRDVLPHQIAEEDTQPYLFDQACQLCKIKDKLIKIQEQQIETLSKLVTHLEKEIR